MSEWEERELLVEEPPEAPGPTGGCVPLVAAEPVFGNVEEWVNGWFVRVFARHPGPNRRWCARWWDHPEAIHRLEDLWRSWEALRLKEDLGMSTWLREHLDPQRDRLMADGGPFHSCDESQHHRPPELPTTAAPAGFWDLSPEQRKRR